MIGPKLTCEIAYSKIKSIIGEIIWKNIVDIGREQKETSHSRFLLSFLTGLNLIIPKLIRETISFSRRQIRLLMRIITEHCVPNKQLGLRDRDICSRYLDDEETHLHARLRSETASECICCTSRHSKTFKLPKWQRSFGNCVRFHFSWKIFHPEISGFESETSICYIIRLLTP